MLLALYSWMWPSTYSTQGLPYRHAASFGAFPMHIE